MSLKSLNKTQKAAVEAIDGPVLIFAGAGSGKTRVLTHKLYYLVDEGLFKPEEILAVTFTNKAAKEMKERVMKLLKANELDLSMGTFHSICARILREDIEVLGFSKHFAIYDVKDQLDLIKVLFEEFEISKTLITPNQLRNQISLFKNKMMDAAVVDRKARTILEKTVSKIYIEYQKNLKLNDALDFDDLLTFPLEIFEKKPSVLKKYQKRWKYILVDEYQDTNRAQFQFLTNLAKAHENICVVGDDDQSIYGWRGADVSNILDFEKTFSSCRVFTLEKNYRSTQEILNAATAVVMNNDKRANKNLVAANGSGETLGLIETIDEQEEASAIVSSIEKEIKLNKRTFNRFRT